MKPARRILYPAISFSLLIGPLCTCKAGRAQDQTPSASSASGSSATVHATSPGPKKPMRKPDQQLTNDSVALLAVWRAPAASEAHGAQVGAAKDDGNFLLDENAKKAAEITSLETQINDKQKRIVLLMRLFVDDERAFVSDPANTKADATAQERRKYEQDELLWETAELAKLKARLNGLTK